MSVQIKRGADEADISKLRFIIGEDDGNSVEHVSSDVVVFGGNKVYYFDVSGIDLVELSVSPVYNVNGEEHNSQMINTLKELPDRTLDFSGKTVVDFDAL